MCQERPPECSGGYQSSLRFAAFHPLLRTCVMRQPCMLLIESHWSFSPLLVVQVCFRFFSLSQYKQASFIYPMAAASPILSSFYWNAAGTKQKLLLIGLLQNSGFFAPHFASTCRVFIHAVASHFPCGSSRFHSFFKQRLS